MQHHPEVYISLTDVFDIVGIDEAGIKFLIEYIRGKVQKTNPYNLYMNCVPKAEILMEFEDFEELLKMRNELEEAAKKYYEIVKGILK